MPASAVTDHPDRELHLTCGLINRPVKRAKNGRPKEFLEQFEGLLQTDGYAAYDQIGGPKMIHAACWSHARRYFFEAMQLNPKDPIATRIVARMDELFAIDAEARLQGMDVAGRHALRQEKARPLLDEIREQMGVARSNALPAGALAKACNYTLTLWERLSTFRKTIPLRSLRNFSRNWRASSFFPA